MNEISIITATYNAAENLRHCFSSLHRQNTHVEHILIDGGSSDGTVDIIREYSDKISHVVSEPDRGVYDALNKGIRLAKGDIIGILHADDYYAGPNSLHKVLNVFQDPAIDSCYADLVYVENSLNEYDSHTKCTAAQVVRYWHSGTFHPNRFYWGWMPPHPTFFVRRSVYEKYGLFNLEMGTSADYELMLRFLLKHKISCQYIPKVLVCMTTGGMSNASLGNRLRAHRHDYKAWSENGLKPYPWTIPLKPIRKIPQWFCEFREE